MMDFFVREVRSIVDGPIAVIRFGTCGGISPNVIPGTVVVASQGSSLVARNYDAFQADNVDACPYTITKVRHCCCEIHTYIYASS
jgi:uridine phosphorylase